MSEHTGKLVNLIISWNVAAMSRVLRAVSAGVMSTVNEKTGKLVDPIIRRNVTAMPRVASSFGISGY